MVDCSMFNLALFNCAFSINKINDAYSMKWDNNENEYICPIIKSTLKKCSLKLANSYDTYETINEDNNKSTPLNAKNTSFCQGGA